MDERNTKNQAPASDGAFERWLYAAHSAAHARRTAERNAAFLLPHLEAGMRLLDAGCGPGSITIGLAEAVAPGEVIGIDANAAALNTARTLAADHGCSNVRFEAGDVYALHFDDASFDAAFVHAVLQHLDDPLAALVELRRVIKPGGVIGVADADHDGWLIAPPDPLLQRANEITMRMKRSPLVGKHLRSLLHLAGFVRTVGSAGAGGPVTDAMNKLNGEWQARYVEAPEYIEHVVRRGWSTEEELRDIAQAWRRWGDDPGAFDARFFCQAVGWAPDA
jgi:ubiquinone/menaquinone biosynthesis C-methylase UbiE